ncbi:MAG: hypothetical protein ACOCX3_00355 [Chloroflexota bacterium]
MAQSINKAWMWPVSSGGVNGANIDDVDRKIHWFDDAVACACGDSAAVQSFEQFRQDGSPLGSIPGDVLEEMHHTIAQIEQQ